MAPGEGLGYLQVFAEREEYGAFLAESTDAGGSNLPQEIHGGSL